MSTPTPDFAHSTLGLSTAQHVSASRKMITPCAVKLAYFGKLASRGDFVRSPEAPELMQKLDRWLARTMESMSQDVRWKATFDAATPLHFVLLGPRQHQGLAGYVVPSQDSSGRRYPFMTTGTFELGEPARFVAVSPLALTRLWSRLATSARLAQSATDLQDVQPLLHAEAVQIDTAPTAHLAGFEAFAGETTLGMLDTLLRTDDAGAPPVARQTILALGLLLQPAVQPGFAQADKAIALPLPQAASKRSAVAAFWLSLLTRFVVAHDVELAIFFVPHKQRPRMLVGFTGASATLLHGLLDPHHPGDHVLDLSHAAWVEDALTEAAGAPPALRKLSGYLQEPELSLKQTMATFREAFARG